MEPAFARYLLPLPSQSQQKSLIDRPGLPPESSRVALEYLVQQSPVEHRVRAVALARFPVLPAESPQLLLATWTRRPFLQAFRIGWSSANVALADIRRATFENGGKVGSLRHGAPGAGNIALRALRTRDLDMAFILIPPESAPGGHVTEARSPGTGCPEQRAQDKSKGRPATRRN